jgi:hypothetical protein
MRKAVILFRSTRDAIRAERICSREAIPLSVIPVPRHISAECGIALELAANLSDRVVTMLAADGIQARVHPQQ